MKHVSIKTIGLMTIALAEDGNLYQQSGRTTAFTLLATPPSPLSIFAIAPAGLVGSSNDSANSATWILPFDVATNMPGTQWQTLTGVPSCPEMVGNEVIWAGIGEDARIYSGCYNRQNPTQASVLQPLADPSNLAVNTYGIFAASSGVTYLTSATGGMGQYGPWQLCTP